MRAAHRALIAGPVLAVLAGAAMLAENAASAAPFDDPSWHEKLGIDQAWQAASRTQSREPLAHVGRALQLRPTSPYTWAALVGAKYRTGVADETFEVALRHAAELGPNEPAVQEAVALFGLAVWDEVQSPTRNAVAAMVAQGLERDPEALMQIAQRRGRLDVACGRVGTTSRLPEKWAQLCKNTGAT